MVATIHIGTHLICDGYDGVVVAVVPPLCNPMRELRRRLGNVPNVAIENRAGEVPLRDTESYVVMAERRGRTEYKWPIVKKVRVRDE